MNVDRTRSVSPGSVQRLTTEGGPYVSRLDASHACGAAAGGPLAGARVAVKDLFDVAGTPTRCGSKVLSDALPAARDAVAVARLRRSGAIVVGKTGLHEFAFGVTGINEYQGTAENPRDRHRIPGGSSSGSAAAVADGSAQFALGSDTGGSSRIPAAFCGVVGFKASFRSIPRAGMFPLAPSLDHVGILADSVATARSAYEVLASRKTARRRPKRIGVDLATFREADHVIASVLDAVLRSIPDVKVLGTCSPDLDVVLGVSSTILEFEAAAIHEYWFTHDSGKYGGDVLARLTSARSRSSADYESAVAESRSMRRAARALWDDADVIVGPTVPMEAPTLVEATRPGLGLRLVRNTRLANLLGIPALTVPVTYGALAAGFQIMGFDDDMTLGAGAIVEQAVGGPAKDVVARDSVSGSPHAVLGWRT